MAEPDPFPVAVPEGASEPAPSKGGRVYPPKGSPEAKAWARKMVDARAAKRAERDRSPVTPPPTSRSAVLLPVPAAVEELETELTAGFAKLGMIMVVPAPVPGTYMLNTAADVAGIVSRLAARNPKLLAALQSSSNIMDYVALGAWGLGFVVAGLVQTQRMPADAPAAKATGVTEIVNELIATGAVTVAGDVPADGEYQPAVDGEGAFAPFEVPIPPDVMARG